MVDIIFHDWTRSIYNVHPIQKASTTVPAYREKQIEKYGTEKFAQCPGILDYKNQGWIMTAWDEFKIYSSEAGTMAYIGEVSAKRCPVGKVKPLYKQTVGCMDQSLTDGVADREVSKFQPLHFDTPWLAKAKDLSLLVLPPVYHSDITNDFMVYPGIVDFSDKFNTLNIIMAPKKEGTFIIKPGTPIAHLIPINKRNYEAEYGPIDSEISQPNSNMLRQGYATCKQFYRKYCMKKTRFSLKKIGEK